MFRDRNEAGELLASMLEQYRNSGALVLAICGGGIQVGSTLARILNAEFSPVIIRKLPCPHDPDMGFGALAEDGGLVISENATCLVSLDLIEWLVDEHRAKLDQDLCTLRNGAKLPSITGRTVIIVDEGIVTGSVMQAAIDLCRRQDAGRIVIAVPIISVQSTRVIEPLADELVAVEKSYYFQKITEWYETWSEPTPEELRGVVDQHNLQTVGN